MKGLEKIAVNSGTIALGVLVAGIAMFMFSDIDLIAKARKGFTGAA